MIGGEDLKKPNGMTYKHNAIYAVYKNDEMIAIGTADECAAELNVQPEYIIWMATPIGKRRYESRKNKDKAQTAVVIDFE